MQWYEWWYYREQGDTFPFNKEAIGRVYSTSKGGGNETPQWLLKANGNADPRRSTRPLNDIELNSSTESEKRRLYDVFIDMRWGSAIIPPTQVSNK